MSALQIAIISNHCEIVVGESLDVKVVLKNAGSAAIEVPSPSEPIQFEFLLRSVPQQMVVYELSRLQALAARSDEPIPASATRTISLAAGNSASYEDNLSRFTVEPLQPGNYLLSAAYRTSSGQIESPGVSLVISAPKLCALALAASLSGLHQAMIHQASPGRAVLLQRLGSAQNPEDGMWYHRGDMSSAMRPGSVAVATECEPSRAVMWYAWTEGESLGAGVAQNQTVFARVVSPPLGLRTPVLQSVGWQDAGESASFVALGTDSHGQVALATVSFLAKGPTSTVRIVPLNTVRLPIRWGVQRRDQGGQAQFDVVFAEEIAGAVRVLRQTLIPDAAEATPQFLLVSHSGPLSALTLDPIATVAGGVVDLLFGPTGEKAEMTFLRVPLTGGAPVVSWTFSAYDHPSSKRLPSAWTMASGHTPDPTVLVKLGDKLMFRQRSGNPVSWSDLAEHASLAEYLRLETVGHQLWAIWADPSAGIQFKIVR